MPTLGVSLDEVLTSVPDSFQVCASDGEGFCLDGSQKQLLARGDNSSGGGSNSQPGFKQYVNIHTKANSVQGLASSTPNVSVAHVNNNSCGGNNLSINVNNFSFLAGQIQKSQSPKSASGPGQMSPGRAPGDPQQQQQQLNSFSGIGKTDGGPGAKRPRKGSGGTLPLKLQTPTTMNNVDNVSTDFLSLELFLECHAGGLGLNLNATKDF